MKKLSIVFGPPLSGKTTFVQDQNNTHHLSVGRLCRQEINQGTVVGSYLKRATLRNWFIPGYILLPLAIPKNMIWLPEVEYVLDGYPKYSHEVDPLLYWCSTYSITLHTLYVINTPIESLLPRLSRRTVCEKCYRSLLPQSCCDCGGLPIQRVEDNPSYFLERYARFQKNINPIIDRLSKHMEIVVHEN